MARNRLTRSGFTLIEMMVAMALSLGIMLILTESFKMALDFVRSANSTGEMISQLNSAGILMTRDLQAGQFVPNNTTAPPAPGLNPVGAKLSDQRYDIPGWTATNAPLGGFFKIVAPTPAGTPLSDAQGFNIYPPATNHLLHFTSILPVNAVFTANDSSGNPYSSQYAEIAYFLAPMNKQTSVQAGGQPLYNLIRRQRLVAYDTNGQSSLTPPGGGSPDADVISVGPAGVNTMTALPSPAPSIMNPPPATNRMTLVPLSTVARYGEDIVVSNVLSFEVKADWTPVAPAASFAGGNTDAPYDYLSTAIGPTGIFDTGSTPPPTIRIKSLQVVIRIYDPRLKAARQNTWKFAM